MLYHSSVVNLTVLLFNLPQLEQLDCKELNKRLVKKNKRIIKPLERKAAAVIPSYLLLDVKVFAA